MKSMFSSCIALFAIAACQSAPGLGQPATVVSVGDGDTIRVMANGFPLTVRLACIDAPESKQPYGKESAAELRSLLPKGQSIELEATGKDRYGRTIGKIRVDGKSINLAMVEKGAAFVYLNYLKPCRDLRSDLIAAEQKARDGKVGLWSQEKICKPWDFRKKKCL